MAPDPPLVPRWPCRSQTGYAPDRGKTVRVATQYAFVSKRADRLYLSRQTGRFVIPLQNGGSGIAVTVGFPIVVQSCDAEPRPLIEQTLVKMPTFQAKIGGYVLPSGDSDQLGYVPGVNQGVSGKVRVGDGLQ